MEGFFAGLGALGIILIVLALLLPLFALIDIYKRRHHNQMMLIVWVLVILFIPYLGSILYFLFGRK